MHLEGLVLSNFRNYRNAEVQFSPKVNLIYGFNAHGKTNLLEAIYLLCLGRSFRIASNQELLHHSSQSFTIRGIVRQDNQIEKSIIVHYEKDGRKEISIDRKRLASHAKVFGRFPVVVMAPDEFKVTAGSPAERRRFIDILLSQVSVAYLSDLQDYSRILKQRNRILHDLKDGKRISFGTLEPWTENLATVGSRIAHSRVRFVSEFSVSLNSLYRDFSGTNDEVELSIESTIYNNEGNYFQAFLNKLSQESSKEKFLGTTLVGPHRDDLVFSINGKDLRKFGSRGEHKSVLISTKVAEFNYLRDMKKETPILLLDDCYSELDNSREQGLFNSIQGLGQIFLTSPKDDFLTSDYSVGCAKLKVESGRVEYA